MKGMNIMKDMKPLKSKIIDNNTVQSQYHLGYCDYTVNSHYAGKDNLDKLFFNILQKKTLVNSAQISPQA